MNMPTSALRCIDCGAPLDQSRDTGERRAPCPTCGSIRRAYTATTRGAQPTNYFLDSYVAHKLSELTACDAPELSDDSAWLNTFILNTVYRVRLDAKIRAYLFNFLRRAEGAISAYRAGCVATKEYISTPRNVISPYFRALGQFEICVSQAYQGYELLSRASGEKIYQDGDGSPEERLQKIYVDAKHMDQMISGDKLPKEATAGVWITNAGLASARAVLAYAELHAILMNMHGLAEKLSKLGDSKK
jgi:hypothetical protein